eukprot:2096162-Amphidinium_carterae.1
MGAQPAVPIPKAFFAAQGVGGARDMGALAEPIPIMGGAPSGAGWPVAARLYDHWWQLDQTNRFSSWGHHRGGTLYASWRDARYCSVRCPGLRTYLERLYGAGWPAEDAMAPVRKRAGVAELLADRATARASRGKRRRRSGSSDSRSSLPRSLSLKGKSLNAIAEAKPVHLYSQGLQEMTLYLGGRGGGSENTVPTLQPRSGRGDGGRSGAGCGLADAALQGCGADRTTEDDRFGRKWRATSGRSRAATRHQAEQDQDRLRRGNWIKGGSKPPRQSILKLEGASTNGSGKAEQNVSRRMRQRANETCSQVYSRHVQRRSFVAFLSLKGKAVAVPPRLRLRRPAMAAAAGPGANLQAALDNLPAPVGLPGCAPGGGVMASVDAAGDGLPGERPLPVDAAGDGLPGVRPHPAGIGGAAGGSDDLITQLFARISDLEQARISDLEQAQRSKKKSVQKLLTERAEEQVKTRGHTRNSKKRKRDKDHDDSSDDDVMVDAKGTVSEIAHERPGELLLSGMKMVQKALQGSGIAGERDETVLSGQVIPYLNSILFPSFPSERLNIRLRRELITLGEALDLLMRGSLDRRLEIY